MEENTVLTNDTINKKSIYAPLTIAFFAISIVIDTVVFFPGVQETSVVSIIGQVLEMASVIFLCFVLAKKQLGKIVFYATCALGIPSVFWLIAYFNATNFFDVLSYILLALIVGAQTFPQLSKFQLIAKKLSFLPAILYAAVSVFFWVSFFKDNISDLFMYNYKILLLEITKIFAILFLSKWCFNPYKVVKEKEVKVVSVSTDSKDAEAPVSAGVLDYNEAYCDIVKHILLSLLTCGVWLFIWIYKTTKALNKAPDSEQYDPTKKLLLCMFVPLYIIYWIYKHGIKIDKLNAFAGRSERNATLFLILGIFIPIVAVILMQDNINKLCVEVTPVATSTTVVTESTKQSKVSDEKHTIDTLKEYKELLDMGVITQEEYDAKKKQLLDL